MARKYRMTGCAKLFLVVLILAPIAYIVASYINGEDGIQNVKDLVGWENVEREEGILRDQDEVYDADGDLQEIIEEQKAEINRLQILLDDCRDQNPIDGDGVDSDIDE